MVKIRILYLLILCLFPGIAMAKVSAHVDRTVIEEGETFQLMLQYDDEEPDLEKLKLSFDILGTSRSSKVSIINGSVNRINEWVVTLAPKSIGTLVVPGLRFGNESTAPIQIKVVKPVASAAKQGADIFLEAKVEQPTAYVQSQIYYSVRLYRAVEIREGSLTEPAFDDAIVERMGEDVTFQTMRNQRRYHVTERRYAIFPQQSGELEIPEMVFQGLVLEAQRNQANSDPFNRFFQTQRTKRVRIKSEKVLVNVKPQPTEFKGDQWLPAKELIFTESWSPEQPEFKVGEPVTRTLRLEALGLTGSQLPELKLFESHGIKSYADQPTVNTGLKGNDMVAIREEKFAIIPTESGKLVLPEIRLSWWDTEFAIEKTASIPPRIIEVAPAAVSQPISGTRNLEEDEPSVQPTEEKIEIVKTVVNPGVWPFIAAGFAFAWLVTLVVAFLVWRKKPASRQDVYQASIESDSTSAASALKDLKKACTDNNPVDAQRAILFWAQAVWQNSSPRSLEKIADDLQDSTVKQAFADLSESLYRGSNQQWNGNAFWDNVSKRLKQPRKDKTKASKALPSLYPQGV